MAAPYTASVQQTLDVSHEVANEVEAEVAGPKRRAAQPVPEPEQPA